MIGVAVRSMLSSTTGVTALVGDRIRPQRLRQGDAYPAIVYQCISDVPQTHLAGDCRRSQARYQIDCYARSQAVAEQLAEAVRQRMHAWRGLTNDGTQIRHSALESQGDFAHEPIHGDDDALYRVTADYVIWYETPPVVHSNL